MLLVIRKISVLGNGRNHLSGHPQFPFSLAHTHPLPTASADPSLPILTPERLVSILMKFLWAPTPWNLPPNLPPTLVRGPPRPLAGALAGACPLNLNLNDVPNLFPNPPERLSGRFSGHFSGL